MAVMILAFPAFSERFEGRLNRGSVFWPYGIPREEMYMASRRGQNGNRQTMPSIFGGSKESFIYALRLNFIE